MEVPSNYMSLNLKNFKEEFKTPYLYEVINTIIKVWNWEGDLSVLPYKVQNLFMKWAEIISKSGVGEGKYSLDYLKKNYINKSDFDKESFFFITSR